MKKKLCLLILCLCLVFMAGCGNNEAVDNSEDNTVSVQSREDDENSSGTESDDLAKEDINIEDIVWNVDEGIVDGERYVLLEYTNNTPYTIAGFEMTFKEKPDATEEQKSAFYTDIQKMTEASDEDMEELKGYAISMHAGTERIAAPGESVTNINCCYYTGYYYLKEIDHYNLVEPDIASIQYVNGDKIHTVYYDYSSGKYSAKSETEEAYQWTQTELENKIPKPDAKIVKSIADTEETFIFEAYGMSSEQFDAYVEKCKTVGYTVESTDHKGFYSANDAEGYNISLTYNEKERAMSAAVAVFNEEREKDSGNEESDNTAIEDKTNEDVNMDNSAEDEDAREEELVDGMRPEFKEAMDSYEAFYDEYCDFMKKYYANPTDLKLLTEYANMLQKSSEMGQKFEAWENDEMNDAELKYYLDVNTRVMQKLLEVSEGE